MLDTAAAPVHDPTTPKPWYLAKSLWLGVLLTLIGCTTYFSDPLHTPAMTLASISEAIGGIAAIVLRVWFTSSTIQGTPVAEQAQLAKESLVLHAVGATPPPRV